MQHRIWKLTVNDSLQYVTAFVILHYLLKKLCIIKQIIKKLPNSKWQLTVYGSFQYLATCNNELLSIYNTKSKSLQQITAYYIWQLTVCDSLQYDSLQYMTGFSVQFRQPVIKKLMKYIIQNITILASSNLSLCNRRLKWPCSSSLAGSQNWKYFRIPNMWIAQWTLSEYKTNSEIFMPIAKIM